MLSGGPTPREREPEPDSLFCGNVSFSSQE